MLFSTGGLAFHIFRLLLLIRNAILALLRLWAAGCWNVKDRKIWRNYSLFVVHIEIPSSQVSLSEENAASRGNCQFEMHTFFCCQSRPFMYRNEEGIASASLLPRCQASLYSATLIENG